MWKHRKCLHVVYMFISAVCREHVSHGSNQPVNVRGSLCKEMKEAGQGFVISQDQHCG